jgi:hypothetical protein
MRRRMPRPSPALVVAVIALVVAAAGGAVAAIPDPDGTIHTCLRAGNLRVIDAAVAECQAGETPLAFNQRGQPGPAGPAGPPGPDELAAGQADLEAAASGPPARVAVKKPKLTPRQALELKPEKRLEAFSVYRDDKTLAPPAGATVASMTLPAGRWVISAKAMVLAGPARCILQAGADFDEVFVLLADAVSLMVVHRFKDPGQVILRCKGRKTQILHINPLTVAGTTVNRVKITAVEVDKLTNQKAKEAK